MYYFFKSVIYIVHIYILHYYMLVRNTEQKLALLHKMLSTHFIDIYELAVSETKEVKTFINVTS